MGNKRVPEVRFAGFSEEWEEKKLGEVVEDISGNDGRIDLPVLTISAGNGWMNQEDRFSQIIAGNELKNYTLLKKGELSYNHGNSKLAKYGAVFELRSYDEALVPKVYHSFKTNDESYSTFLEYLFSSKIPDKELRKLISSGARMDGLLNISKSAFFGINMILPTTKEQTLIGNFFKHLDDTIALKQRELENLKQTKQGFLQKMFPKDGESVPEIRFAGCVGDWEEIKMEDGNSKIGDGLHGTPIYCDEAKVAFINGNNLINGKIEINKNTKFIEEIQQSNNDKSLNNQTILMSINGTIGNLAYYNGEKVMLGKSVAFLTVSSLSKHFLYQVLQTKSVKTYFLNNLTGTTIKNLGLKTIRETVILVPKYEEQTLIGNFFKQLDDTINLHGQELEAMKQTKKAFLQKMFV